VLAVLRENKQKGAKGGCEPCPASTAGFFNSIAHSRYKINRINMNFFKKARSLFDSFNKMMVKKS